MAKLKIRENYHQARWDEPIIYELSTPGERGILVPQPDKEIKDEAVNVLSRLPENMRRKEKPNLPEISQKHVLAHYLHLSQETLGSNLNNDISQGTCTMKYNPRINEKLTTLIHHVHPSQDESTMQGILGIYYRFEHFLKEISGMDKFTLQPGGGSHAVYTAASIIRAYHESNGELEQRDEVITTIFSHPCDAATPATAGFKVVTLFPNEETGIPDIEALREAVSERTAAVFITNPEDTGIYNKQIDEFVEIVHEAGGLCFYDQANANGMLGIARAREAGFDMCHFNVHKTFGTPHGCSGPGTGALGVREHLARFLPVPTVEFDGDRYYLDYDRPESIGKVRGFFGVAPVVLKAYSWVMMLGAEGLKEVAEISVLNNNYLQKKIEEIPGVDVWYARDRRRLEQVRYNWMKLEEETGVGTDDIMRRIGDYGIQHYWTSHHPWVVPEPFTLEPCETYSKIDLDEYAAVLERIAEEARKDPEFVKASPHKCASNVIAKPEELNDPEKWAVTWRAYLKKHNKG
ncbi:aminomethyl-transferring glycine dehydrogenase subunit GcvPB [Clostridium sp. Cult2]|uniref:aminomethyl-transferring glycine dehydrogenase subunit GcvPB n=1 Tax=Clostridium sp. Cult2 TaxID=2079003 RepID=UPI001F00F895|nr:aminomethyl-transferring glycine dehydrogenase subunit GcvPB [Clostridium sp. Cult2]MCF6465577.1 glycine dehydrogenase subunit 2 [Clostridium sp. Cult2]